MSLGVADPFEALRFDPRTRRVRGTCGTNVCPSGQLGLRGDFRVTSSGDSSTVDGLIPQLHRVCRSAGRRAAGRCAAASARCHMRPQHVVEQGRDRFQLRCRPLRGQPR